MRGPDTRRPPSAVNPGPPRLRSPRRLLDAGCSRGARRGHVFFPLVLCFSLSLSHLLRPTNHIPWRRKTTRCDFRGWQDVTPVLGRLGVPGGQAWVQSTGSLLKGVCTRGSGSTRGVPHGHRGARLAAGQDLNLVTTGPERAVHRARDDVQSRSAPAPHHGRTRATKRSRSGRGRTGRGGDRAGRERQGRNIAESAARGNQSGSGRTRGRRCRLAPGCQTRGLGMAAALKPEPRGTGDVEQDGEVSERRWVGDVDEAGT